MKVPNYNLLRYELDENSIKNDISKMKAFFRRVFDKCGNDRESIFNWFMNLDEKQLSDIGVKKIISHSELADSDIYTRFVTIAVVKTMDDGRMRIMTPSAISSKYESKDRIEYRLLTSLL